MLLIRCKKAPTYAHLWKQSHRPERVAERVSEGLWKQPCHKGMCVCLRQQRLYRLSGWQLPYMAISLNLPDYSLRWVHTNIDTACAAAWLWNCIVLMMPAADKATILLVGRDGYCRDWGDRSNVRGLLLNYYLVTSPVPLIRLYTLCSYASATPSDLSTCAISKGTGAATAAVVRLWTR
jgi:hypothetical protein